MHTYYFYNVNGRNACIFLGVYAHIFILLHVVMRILSVNAVFNFFVHLLFILHFKWLTDTKHIYTSTIIYSIYVFRLYIIYIVYTVYYIRVYIRGLVKKYPDS